MAQGHWDSTSALYFAGPDWPCQAARPGNSCSECPGNGQQDWYWSEALLGEDAVLKKPQCLLPLSLLLLLRLVPPCAPLPQVPVWPRTMPRLAMSLPQVFLPGLWQLAPISGRGMVSPEPLQVCEGPMLPLPLWLLSSCAPAAWTTSPGKNWLMGGQNAAAAGPGFAWSPSARKEI